MWAILGKDILIPLIMMILEIDIPMDMKGLMTDTNQDQCRLIEEAHLEMVLE